MVLYLNLYILKSSIFLEKQWGVSRQKVNGIKTESNYNFIKDLEIPLPSLKRQKELVAQYNDLLTLANNKQKQAEELEKSIDNYLMNELSIEKPKEIIRKNLFQQIDFENLDVWDINFQTISYASHKYKNIPFSQTIIPIKSKINKLKTNEFKSVGKHILKKFCFLKLKSNILG